MASMCPYQEEDVPAAPVFPPTAQNVVAAMRMC